MAGTDNRHQDANDSSDAGTGLSGKTGHPDDLRTIFHQLPEQNADADRRHSNSLREMRERLGRIGEQAAVLQQSLPRHVDTDRDPSLAGTMTSAPGQTATEANWLSRVDARPTHAAPPPCAQIGRDWDRSSDMGQRRVAELIR